MNVKLPSGGEGEKGRGGKGEREKGEMGGDDDSKLNVTYSRRDIHVLHSQDGDAARVLGSFSIC